jgi:hypothetical protein
MHSEKSIDAGDSQMPIAYGHPRFFKLAEIMQEIHRRKNSNYAKAGKPLSNFDRAKELGIPAWKGVLIRLSDKWSRIVELSKGKTDAVGESLSDTLIDAANYALICMILLEEELGVEYELDENCRLVPAAKQV